MTRALLLLALAVPASAAVDPRLMMEMRGRLGLPRVPVAGEGEVLDRALEDVLGTPTGEALARTFVAEDARAPVSFGDLPGRLMEHEGRLELAGVTAQTGNRGLPRRVTINRLYLGEDAAIRGANIAATLAHEVFGHAFEAHRARASGAPDQAYAFFGGDELNARLIGWLVRRELRAPVSDEAMELFLRDRDGYFRRSYSQDPSYAVKMTVAEMRDPLGAVRSRIAVIDAAAALNESEPDAVWREFMRGRIAESRAAVAQQIGMWLPDRSAEAVRAGAEHPYFAEAERRIAALEARLRAPAR